jgi:hypothetical protein
MFYLAMSYWKLGDESKARDCYEQAETSMKAYRYSVEQRRLRRETAELLGIED